MASPSGWVSESPSHELTDSLGGRSQQRRVEITHDQGAAWRSLCKWYSLVRSLGLRVPLTVGLCYRPAICPGPLNDAAECKVKRGIPVPASRWGALVPVGS
jgi:hypothetical protein